MCNTQLQHLTPNIQPSQLRNQLPILDIKSIYMDIQHGNEGYRKITNHAQFQSGPDRKQRQEYLQHMMTQHSLPIQGPL